jgi:inosine-uridine nucleoside N-ribohydrolase
VAQIFQRRPELKDKVEEIVIMGGAIKVPGNVEKDESVNAEWNFYADPQATKHIWNMNVPIRLIPLDLTNELPVTKEFLERLAHQCNESKASLLATKLWSLVKGFTYYFWDTITAAAVIAPEFFSFKEMRLNVSNEGKLSTSLFGGRKVKVAVSIQKQQFEDLLLSLLYLR